MIMKSKSSVNLSCEVTLAWNALWFHISCRLSKLRASSTCLIPSLSPRWSLWKFWCMNINYKVSLSSIIQVARDFVYFWSEHLACKEFAHLYRKVCQCDRQWTLYLILAIFPTLKHSPFGTFTHPLRIEHKHSTSRIWPQSPHKWPNRKSTQHLLFNC